MYMYYIYIYICIYIICIYVYILYICIYYIYYIYSMSMYHILYIYFCIGTKFSKVFQHSTTLSIFFRCSCFLVAFIFCFIRFYTQSKTTWNIQNCCFHFFKSLGFCRCNLVVIDILFFEVFMRCTSFFSKNVIVA